MAKETKAKEKPKGFSEKVKFIQPFEGSFQAGFTGKTYTFKVRTKDIWKKGKLGPKTPVEMEIDNEVLYNWLIKFEAVIA